MPERNINDKYPTGVKSRPSVDAFIYRPAPMTESEVERAKCRELLEILNAGGAIDHNIFKNVRRVQKCRAVDAGPPVPPPDIVQF